MRRGPLLELLLLTTLVIAVCRVTVHVEATSLSDICGSGCNFTSLHNGLTRTLAAAAAAAAASDRQQSAPEAAAGDSAAADFVGGLAALNLRLPQQLDEAANCAKRWLARPPGDGCYDICCPEPSLGSLLPALNSLRADVKLSISGAATAAYKALQKPTAYQDAAFDTYNVFSGAFMDFARQLAVDSARARTELDTFGMFYARLTPLPHQLSGNASSLISSSGAASDCASLRPLWRNMFGVALQQLVMCRLAGGGSSANAEAVWQVYTSVVELVTRSTIECNSAMARERRRQLIDADGSGGSDGRSEGLRGSDIALAVLVPALLLLIIVIFAALFWRWRRRRRRRRQLRVQAGSVGEAEGGDGGAAVLVGKAQKDDDCDDLPADVAAVGAADSSASRSAADGADLQPIDGVQQLPGQTAL